MIRIEGDWVIFRAEDNDLFYPKQFGDELRVSRPGTEGSWHAYGDDIRNGYLKFTDTNSNVYKTEHRRPLRLCTPEQLAVIKGGGAESQHFI